MSANGSHSCMQMVVGMSVNGEMVIALRGGVN